MKHVQRRGPMRATISMLNLIDVVFILLLFFMLTTTFNKLTQYDLKLPESSISLQKADTDLVQIFYQKDGQMSIEQNGKVSKTDINSLLNTLVELGMQKEKSVVLNADESIKYGDIINAISLIKQSGIDDLKLNIQTH